jgi:hypothetical protein
MEIAAYLPFRWFTLSRRCEMYRLPGSETDSGAAFVELIQRLSGRILIARKARLI